MKFAKWKRREPGVENKYEAAWREHVEKNIRQGGIFYEPIKFRLADRTYYTPDYIMLAEDQTIEAHEVKGSWLAPGQDDSRVKIKVAADLYPWIKFVAICAKPVAKKNGGGWHFTIENISKG